ncbi:FtsH protease activity modulator HflK [Burkholderia dolosa]|uniref:Protein HflK n=1 Tax=Burkholderia dolosa TaxID=152500 RepID=A0A892I6U4_9BURK|nr:MULTISPECIES: FtsH protease activity modulator HflK [Burkholderia]AKE03569.1 membrane protein [Burkholderia cepacia]AYZ98333.1 FtsH protease activity modulator HflK [Burkholderia dolosa]EAY68753.1 HflK [Burkholderia dolosa AU0158]ETP65400.1 membrane protein [Burkholderia dolosa PC543]MBR8417301.1 FtsH protease activity modulator HflK [Burkholderia dolosa]
MNEYNERSTWRRMRALLSINDPRWGRGEGNGGSRPRVNESKRPPGGDGDGPPDLDEMWRNFNRRLSGLFGGRGGNGLRPDNGRAARVGVGIVIGVLVAIYAGSGLFVVQEGQTGVVLQLGKLAGTVGQGVHWRPPYPFASHEIVDTSQVRSIEVGRNNVVRLANVKEAAMLTRDADIVDVRFIVRYRIRSATDYLFRSVDPERSVSQAAQAAVRAIVGTRSAADILSQDRDALREQISAAIQRDLDRYRSGLEVTAVTMQSIAAPEQTQAAYAEVAKARDEREAAKRAAQAYANDLLPKAQGDAAKLVDEAKAYADRVVTEAEGDADRFKQVYAQYSKAPAVIRERMYLQTMQEIYSKATKVFVGSNGGSNVVYLPLDKLVEQGRQSAAAAGASAPDAASAATAGAAASAPASAASAAATPAPGSDVLRSREAFRSRSREDDTK